jgi:hypothetical protein
MANLLYTIAGMMVGVPEELIRRKLESDPIGFRSVIDIAGVLYDYEFRKEVEMISSFPYMVVEYQSAHSADDAIKMNMTVASLRGKIPDANYYLILGYSQDLNSHTSDRISVTYLPFQGRMLE